MGRLKYKGWVREARLKLHLFLLPFPSLFTVRALLFFFRWEGFGGGGAEPLRYCLSWQRLPPNANSRQTKNESCCIGIEYILSDTNQPGSHDAWSSMILFSLRRRNKEPHAIRQPWRSSGLPTLGREGDWNVKSEVGTDVYTTDKKETIEFSTLDI